jgi:hypothetical protein
MFALRHGGRGIETPLAKKIVVSHKTLIPPSADFRLLMSGSEAALALPGNVQVVPRSLRSLPAGDFLR